MNNLRPELVFLQLTYSKMKYSVLFLFLISRLLMPGVSAQQKGSLLIAGGALKSENKAVYEKILELAGGAEKAVFGVIPAASGAPVSAFESFKETLTGYGVKAGNIHLVNVAMMDDKSTEFADESKWAGNAEDKRVAGILKTCTAVWFTGGDQMRVLMTLIRADGNPTLVLQAVNDVYARGGMIGGSSAGAAIMGPVMIAAGSSSGAFGLSTDTSAPGPGGENSSGEPLFLTNGLGFFRFGIVDQHFNQRARLGRLCMALAQTRDKASFGVGVDENTALIYYAAENKIQVIGENGLTMLNAEEVQINGAAPRLKIANLKFSYLEHGDEINLSDMKVTPAPHRFPIHGNEEYELLTPPQSGLLDTDAPGFRELATRYLANNKLLSEIRRTGFIGTTGITVVISKTLQSRAYVSSGENGKKKYTLENFRLDFEPVKIEISPVY
ncbi:cyanophycinase [Lentimicrobium sp.]|uniref:cyanophycinase n=1 Tax=Lentimicrobium sp. TaxID=2034841 RepID=UPI00345E4C26